jgi:hypothetical protein
LASELGDVLAGNDEFAALAIDMAQHGFGGGNPVQTDLALGELDVHGLISFRVWKGRASRQIDQS